MPGTSNFLTFNPSQVNQETDAQWTADSLRTGGVPAGAIVPSQMMNKAWNQATVMAAALGQMLATKGYTVSDANQNQLAAVLAAIVTQADLPAPMVSVAFASTLTFNAATTRGWDIALTGNVTASTLTGLAPGQVLTFILRQGPAGGATISWPSQMAANAPQPNLAPYAVSTISVIVATDNSVRPLTPMTVS